MEYGAIDLKRLEVNFGAGVESGSGTERELEPGRGGRTAGRD